MSTCFLMPLYLLAGNLSGQSAASVLHPQQTLHPPGNIPESGQNQLLQPLKPSPSSDNLYSAFTSDGAISVPSLSAPGQGNKATVIAKNNKMEMLPYLGQQPVKADWETSWPEHSLCVVHLRIFGWKGSGVTMRLSGLIAPIRWNYFFSRSYSEKLTSVWPVWLAHVGFGT